MGFHSNFHMATDRGIGSQNQLRPFPVRRSEHPFTGFNLLEITILAPAGSSYRMTAPYPGPQRSEDLVIHPSENFLCNDVPMIIGPSPDDRIKRLDQEYLGCCFGFLQDVPDFIQKALNVLSSGPNQELSAKFPDILSKEIKTFPHMRDPSLLIREFQTPFTKKFDNYRADFVFQDVFRASRHDKSGRGNALLRHPPLRTDRAACTAVSSSLSRRLFLPKESGDLVEQGMRGFLNLFQKGDSPFAGTFELLALLKVFGPLWIKRIGILSDLDMAPYRDVRHTEQDM